MDLRSLLSQLKPGDLIHGKSPRGAVLICLVLRIDSESIYTRRITTGEDIQFDLEAGSCDGSLIDSVARLPAEHYEALIGLDRRYQAATTLEEHKLTRAEKDALLFLKKFYAAHPLRSSRQ